MSKPKVDRFAVVTATTSPRRAKDCLWSWRDRATYDWPLYIVWNGVRDRGDEVGDSCLRAEWGTEPEIGGVVPMFARGVHAAINRGAQIIACLHDDLLIEEQHWDARVIHHFDVHPRCGLAGFGGGTGLGSPDLYRTPYDPMQLARVNFISNMRDAEQHGTRVTTPTRVACLDGFSQIGTADFFADAWPYMRDKLKLTHHFYDGCLGALAKRVDLDAWLIPVACHHFGGRTAVGDTRYHAWAQAQDPDGDHGFWQHSHKVCYDDLRDVLPIRV